MAEEKKSGVIAELLEKTTYVFILLTLFSLPLFEAPKNIAFVSALFLFFIGSVLYRKKFPLAGIDKALLLFLFLTLVSAIFSPYRDYALKKGAWDTFRFVMLFFLVKYSIDTKAKIKFAILIIIISMMIGDLIGIKHYLEAPSLESINFIGYRTSTATYLALFLSLTFGILLTNKPKKNPFFFLVVAATILTLGVLSLSLTRATLFSVSVIFLIFCALRRHFKILALGCLLIILFLSLFVPLKERIKMLKPDFYVRCAIWQGALKIIKDRPFLGIGPKTYSLKENRVKYNLPRDIRSSDAHSVFLNIASERGLIGLFSFLIFLGLYLHLLSKTRNREGEIITPLWYACLGNFIHLFVIGIGYSMLSTESAMLFMAILGLFSSSIKVERV